MQFRGLRYSAALAAAFAAGPVNMALAQSADASLNGSASGSIEVAQQTYLDVMANLEAAGYAIVQTKSTFLGRVQITAQNAEHVREVVVSRATGEVKSDVIVQVFATGGSSGGAAAAGASATSGGTSGSVGASGSLGAGADVSVGVTGSATGEASSGGSVSVDAGGGVSVGIGN